MYICIYIYIYIYSHIHTYVYAYVCVYIYIYTLCMCVYMYVCVCIYIYIYIYIRICNTFATSLNRVFQIPCSPRAADSKSAQEDLRGLKYSYISTYNVYIHYIYIYIYIYVHIMIWFIRETTRIDLSIKQIRKTCLHEGPADHKLRVQWLVDEQMAVRDLVDQGRV